MVEKKKLLSLFVSLRWALLLRKINTFFFFFAHVFFYFCRRRHFELHAREEKKFRFHSLSLFFLSRRARFYSSSSRSNDRTLSSVAHRKGVLFFFFLSFSPCGAKQRDCESPEEEKKNDLSSLLRLGKQLVSDSCRRNKEDDDPREEPRNRIVTTTKNNGRVPLATGQRERKLGRRERAGEVWDQRHARVADEHGGGGLRSFLFFLGLSLSFFCCCLVSTFFSV